MEPVSFTIGIAGLVGLFSSCLEVIDRLQSFKNFDFELRYTRAQFDADKHLLQRWATGVGIGNGKLIDKHHPGLDDPETVEKVERILSSIYEILNVTDGRLSALQSDEAELDEPSFASSSDVPKKTSFFKGKRLRWAAGGKTRFNTKVEVFGVLVEKLYSLVRPTDATQLLDPDSLKRLDDIRNSLDAGKAEASNWFDESRTSLREILDRVKVENEKDLHHWLDPTSTDARYDACLTMRVPSTCDWIFDNSVYRDWASSDSTHGSSRILWIYGPPGFGKSVLCARIVECLSASSSPTPCYFFCSSDVESQCIPLNIVRTWISQIVSQRQAAFEVALQHMQTGRPRASALQSDVWEVFKAILRSTTNAVFIVDGLDECLRIKESQQYFDNNMRKDFLQRLRKSAAGTSAKILIVSREDTDIISELGTVRTKMDGEIVYEYKLSKEDMRSDLRLFSQSTVNMKLPNKSEDLQSNLAEKMAEKCDGMFLWIKMQEKQLRGGKNAKQLMALIEAMPPGLERAYQREWTAICNLPKSDQNRALAILRWVMFAERPLTVSELTEALIVNEHDHDFNTDMLPDQVDREYVNSEILDICGSLIEIRTTGPQKDLGSQTVHLTHFSVKEFLLSVTLDKATIFADGDLQNSDLAMTCLRYLHYDKVWHRLEANIFAESDIGFMNYAAINWSTHLQKAVKNRSALIDLVIRFFQSENSHWGTWRRYYEFKTRQRDSENLISKRTTSSRLSVASFLGIAETAKFLLDTEPEDLNRAAGHYGTPLQAACAGGHDFLVNLLLEHGADLDQTGGSYGCAINCALALGHETIARRLLNDGASLFIKDPLGQTAIHHAVQSGSLTMTKLLLDAGADIKIKSDNGSTSLHMSTLKGGTDLVKLLLGRGADPNEMNKEMLSPLLAASVNSNVAAAEALLEYGADVMKPGYSLWTPLYIAAFNSCEELVNLFIDAGADPNCADEEDSTPLIIAVQKGDVHTSKVLLNRGADPNDRSERGWAPLYFAAVEGNIETMKLLLQYGAAVTTKYNSFTPLHVACHKNDLESAALLLDHNADVNATSTWSWTALNIAAYLGNLPLATLLLKAGADTTIASNRGRTPLISAAMKGHVQVSKLLLDNGASILDTDLAGWTALTFSCRYANRDLIELLLRYGAQDTPTARSAHITPLVIAVTYGKSAVVDILLGREAHTRDLHENSPAATTTEVINGYYEMPESRSNFSSYKTVTLVHYAAFSGHLGMIKKLEKYGANLTLRDDSGYTVLHFAAGNGHVEVVEWLLDQQHGLSINCKDNRGTTALALAATEGHVPVVRCLASRAGVDVDSQDLQGTTPLFQAVLCQQLNVARSLIQDFGAETNVTSYDGRSLLHIAAAKGSISMFDLLLSFGLDLHARDKRGQSVVTYAISWASYDIVERLLPSQDVDEPGDGNWSALHWACRAGGWDLIDLLLKNGYKSWVVTTKEPIGSWTPLDIALVHQNDKILSEEDHPARVALKACVEHAQNPDKLRNDGKSQASKDEMECSWGVHQAICDLCDHDIYGPRFHCTKCEDFDYCFMCKTTSHLTHAPDHEWVVIEPNADNLTRFQKHTMSLRRVLPALYKAKLEQVANS